MTDDLAAEVEVNPKSLAKKSPKVWRNKVDDLMIAWRSIHIFRQKHFKTAERARDKRLVNDVTYHTSRTMSYVMKELLESTNTR